MLTALVLGGIALFWVVVAFKVERGRRDGRWRLGRDAPVDVPLPRLAVVVPARDEAANIAACVAALRASDHPAFDVVVFDDGSTDGTAALAEAAGARVLAGGGGPLPEGWKGKPWALHRATRDVSAEWILFVDADVRVAPEALSRVHAHAVREGLDLLSGLGRLEMGSFWERVIQPSVGGLIIGGNDLSVVNDPARPDKAIANGQLILVRRAAYEAVGGHAAVRDDILDDIGLARAFTGAGLRVRCLFMRELFSCRMYTGLRELWLGWTKNLFAGLRYRRSAVVGLVALVLVDFLLPYALLAWGLLRGDGALALQAGAVVALMQGVRFRLDRIFEQDWRYGFLQPLGALALVGLVIDSARRTRRGALEWKGRRYGRL